MRAKVRKALGLSASSLAMTLTFMVLAGCGRGPSQKLLCKAVAARDHVKVSSVEVLERHKPYEDSYRTPGEKVRVYGFVVRINDSNGTRRSELRVQQLLAGDQSWWVETSPDWWRKFATANE